MFSVILPHKFEDVMLPREAGATERSVYRLGSNPAASMNLFLCNPIPCSYKYSSDAPPPDLPFLYAVGSFRD
jgi:hypothetical protein